MHPDDVWFMGLVQQLPDTGRSDRNPDTSGKVFRSHCTNSPLSKRGAVHDCFPERFSTMLCLSLLLGIASRANRSIQDIVGA